MLGDVGEPHLLGCRGGEVLLEKVSVDRRAGELF
jgi:hypothetical protein